jgi:hypothetical protein
MVRAIGSFLTKHYENALAPGLVLHYFFGVLFTFLYIYVWGLFPEIAADGIWRYVADSTIPQEKSVGELDCSMRP